MILLVLGLAFIILTAIGMPISFAVGVSTVIATLLLPGVDNATIVQRMLTAINTFPLLAVIFFVFAGTLMARGGIARRLVLMAEVLVGWLPGASRRSSASPRCSSAASPARPSPKCRPSARMMIPAMEKDGYSRRFATAIVLTAATMGPIIPPSIGMIVFAHVAGNVSIAALFLAGVMPGVHDRPVADGRVVRPRQALSPEEAAEAGRREKIRRVLDGMAGVFTMVIILGGIISGIFTATEAGAAAAVYALILTVFVYKEIKMSELPEIIWECCVTNAVVMMLIATCSVYRLDSHLRESADHAGGQFLQPDPEQMGVPADPQSCFLLVVGMFVDMTPALIMLVPMLLPLALKFDIDLVHLGLIMVINLAFGLTTPPVGTALVRRAEGRRNCRWRRSSRRCCRCSPACASC